MSGEIPDERPGAAEPAGGDDEPRGVFGNLPQSRPGARSPRRATAAGSPPRTAGPGAAKPASSFGEGEPREEAQAAEDRAPEDPAPPPPHAGGLEDVAWAGVAAAAEAATLGVRLATRALEAMRDAVDRR